jgi:VanZ family protein
MTNRLWIVRILLWASVIGAVTLAIMPQPPQLPIDTLGDKFEHSLAFSVMALLGAFAYPSFPLPRLGERLSFLGALIEVVQSIPTLKRDCDIMDWITDTIAIIVALLLVALFRRLRGRPVVLPGTA